MKKEIISTTIKLCITMLAPIIFFLGYIFVDSLEYDHVGKNEVIQNYSDNKNIFDELSNYLEKSSEDVSIDKDKEKYFTIYPSITAQDNTESNVDKEKIRDDIIYLFYKLKFKHISEEHNKIYFVRQTDLRFEQGIIFSKDGKEPSDSSFIRLDPIDGNWYYYESK